MAVPPADSQLKVNLAPYTASACTMGAVFMTSPSRPGQEMLNTVPGRPLRMALKEPRPQKNTNTASTRYGAQARSTMARG